VAQLTPTNGGRHSAWQTQLVLIPQTQHTTHDSFTAFRAKETKNGRTWMAGHVLLLLAPAIRKDTEEVEVSVIVPDNTVKTEVKVL